jgi:hypothetical protein
MKYGKLNRAEPKQALKEMLAFMGIEPDESLL